jgi:acetyl-CoA synthetase
MPKYKDPIKHERVGGLQDELLQSGYSPEETKDVLKVFYRILCNLPPEKAWHKLVKMLLKRSASFSLYKNLYLLTYSDWQKIPAPVWFPEPAFLESTHLAMWMKRLHFGDFHQFHTWSVEQYPKFWEMFIYTLPIVLTEKYTKIVNVSDGIESPQWLFGAKLNIVESCFKARASTIAVVYQDKDAIKKMTYGELETLSNRVANSLSSQVKKGDRVALILPMTPEAVAVYLGIIKAGACAVPIPESFSTEEIAVRLSIVHTKLIFAQNTLCRDGKNLAIYTKLLPIHDLPPTVVLNAQKGFIRSQDIHWNDFLSDNAIFHAMPCDPQDETTILFSSGTTGEPKAVPWTHTTPIKCASDAYFHQNINSDDVLCWPTSLGWMMGPWLVYAALINNATLALYNGVPTEKKFGKFVQVAKVTMLGVVPTLVRTWRNLRCMESCDWSHIKCFSSTGECSNVEDMLYLMWLGHHKPIIEYCGGTEIGGAYITSTLITPLAPAAFNAKAMGSDFLILDEKGMPATKGEVALIPPALGLSTTLLNKNHHAIYYADMPNSLQNGPLRRHGDAMEAFKHGFYRLLGRMDDTMNLSGVKVSAVEIERVLALLPEIKEVAAIAINPFEGGPSKLVVYAVVHPTVHTTETLTTDKLKSRMQNMIKQSLNPLFKISEVIVVETLPKTVSKKIMRNALRALKSEK